MDGESLYELIEQEGVTFSAAVPTVWQGLLHYLRGTGRGFSTLHRVVIGGAAPPPALIRAFQDDYGVEVVQGWGMTETSPLATLSSPTAEVLAQPTFASVREGISTYGSRRFFAADTTLSASPTSDSFVFLSRGVSFTGGFLAAISVGFFLAMSSNLH